MKKLYLVLMFAAAFLFNGCTQGIENLGAAQQKEMIFSTNENIKLDTRTIDKIKYEKSYVQMFIESYANNELHGLSKYYNKKFYLKDRIYQVKYSIENGNFVFNLKDLKEDKNVVTFDYRYDIIIWDDTDVNDKLYFGLKKIYNGYLTYSKFDKLYSFDGVELKEINKELKERSMYLGKTRIISNTTYHNKYIVYTINTASYNRYEFVNILNDKVIKFKATLLAIKDNKALLYSSVGSELFNNKQHKLSVLNLDTEEETTLMIVNNNLPQPKLRFYESKSQLIVSLPNGQNIDIVSLKNVRGNLKEIDPLKAYIYNIDKLSSEEFEMSLKEIGWSIKTNFDDTRPVLINDN